MVTRTGTTSLTQHNFMVGFVRGGIVHGDKDWDR